MVVLYVSYIYIPFVPMTPAPVRSLSLAHGPHRRQFISPPRTAFASARKSTFADTRICTYYVCMPPWTMTIMHICITTCRHAYWYIYYIIYVYSDTVSWLKSYDDVYIGVSWTAVETFFRWVGDWINNDKQWCNHHLIGFSFY